MDKPDPKLLQVLIRQIAQNLGINRVRLESGLVLFQTQDPQPTPDVHDRDCGQAFRHLPGYTAACPRHLPHLFKSGLIFEAI
jgi:hypothetical protein